MSATMRAGLAPALLILLLAGLAPADVAAQGSTAPLAKELAQLLDSRQLDAVAARMPDTDDEFVAVLYFKDLEFLVVSARYAAPQLANDRIASKEYRDIYIDLNSASVAGTKVFVEDLKADGLAFEPKGGSPPDSIETADQRTMFDGDWKKAKLSEQEYRDRFAAAERQYSKMLSALIAELKKAS
ncbi:MAG: hypothetical protein KJ061_18005 [Vicinamibacteraceae bacterium]|nr:hypothetical protein [Vicinamibacteraceae bacterium]